VNIVSELKLNKKEGFTLAEALITLVIIGVIAALTIPGILVNTEQHEYKSALKKALSSLNNAIEMNIALDGYGPIEAKGMNEIDHEDCLFNMISKRMNVISTSENYAWGNKTDNYAMFTADGMRFEFPKTPELASGYKTAADFATNNGKCAGPIPDDEDGVIDEEGNELRDPCLIIVDVNGDRRPNPRSERGSYKIPKASTKSRVLDVFPILINDKNAHPFGLVGQRVLFEQLGKPAPAVGGP